MIRTDRVQAQKPRIPLTESSREGVVFAASLCESVHGIRQGKRISCRFSFSAAFLSEHPQIIILQCRRDGARFFRRRGVREHTQQHFSRLLVSRDIRHAIPILHFLYLALRARPGHSEHQTGLAVDLNSLEYAFADTPEGLCIAAHCHEYGFILRYPQDKEDVTGNRYEPWHVRYLGTEAAAKVAASGLCLEEYLGITSVYAD